MTGRYEYFDYIKALGKKEASQFEKAWAKPLTRLENEIGPHLLFDDCYYPLSETTYRPGRNHLATERVKAGTLDIRENCFFGNALTKVGADYDAKGKATYQAPSERTRLGPLMVYTFEFDYLDQDFFRRQLGWLRSQVKKKTDCPMGRFYKACTQWSDFRGITVNWSGHKSLHIHAVFDTSVYRKTFGEPGPSFRDGYMAHWRDLEVMLLTHLKLVGTGYTSDQQLKCPEQYRRMSNSWRVISGDDHLLGIPAGTQVQQVTLWEMWTSRASKAANGLFHSPTKFAQNPRMTASARHRARSVDAFGAAEYSIEEIAYCTERLREIYPDDSWPRLAHLDCESGRWVARFWNSAGDRNPSSIIKEGYRTVMVQGRDTDSLKPPSLPASLGEMLARWAEQTHEPSHQIVEAEGPEIISRTRLEREFAKVSNAAEATEILDRYLPPALVYSVCPILVNGPEGSGKTSALLRRHPWIASQLEGERGNDRANPRRALYAFLTYVAAAEKCAAFNSMHKGTRFVGIVLFSFSETYRQVCEQLRLHPISQEYAAQKQHASLWNAIQSEQPQVIEEFRIRHGALWSEIADCEPVFFTVHQVAHGWDHSSPSRMMWAPSFWSARDEVRTHICREETRLSLLVHDEIKREAFVAMVSQTTHDWITRLKNTATAIWPDGSLTARHAAFRQFTQANRPPQNFSLDDISRLVGLDFADTVVTANTGEYGPCEDGDIYRLCHGQEWRVASRDWWQKTGALRTIFLTTEAVLTAIAQRADPDIAVITLNSNRLEPHGMDVYPGQGVVADKLASTVGTWLGKQTGDWFVVSNKVAQNDAAMSHARARGTNGLIGRNVIQTMTFMSTGEYEEIQALNAWCGREDLVLLRHIDECNQTAGRNLGFRFRQGASHVLLIGHRLLSLLLPVLGWSRYDWNIHLTPEQQRTVRRKKQAKDMGEDCADNDNVDAARPATLAGPAQGFRSAPITVQSLEEHNVVPLAATLASGVETEIEDDVIGELIYFERTG